MELYKLSPKLNDTVLYMATCSSIPTQVVDTSENYIFCQDSFGEILTFNKESIKSSKDGNSIYYYVDRSQSLEHQYANKIALEELKEKNK